jgi:HPt (histidine-containing phosphotransfer) domain-containing protein
MQKAVIDGDRPALATAAHTLRGSAANVGAGRLSSGCAAVETSLRAPIDEAQLTALVAIVASEAEAAQAAMTTVTGQAAR